MVSLAFLSTYFPSFEDFPASDGADEKGGVEVLGLVSPHLQ